jgi:hypothetical protein
MARSCRAARRISLQKDDHMTFSAIPRDEQVMARRIARIEAGNARFRTLEPARKRVAIAKDVLKWLDSKKLLVPQLSGSAYLDGIPMYQDEGVPSVVNGGTCQACAIGAIFAVAVEKGECGGTLYRASRNGNRPALVTTDQGVTDIHEKLAPFFDVKQLCLIEQAFEGADQGAPCRTQRVYVYGTADGCDEGSESARERRLSEDEEWQAATAFGKAASVGLLDLTEAREARMRAIMNNIIANKGTFRP